MTDKEKLKLLVTCIRPECLYVKPFIKWWIQQDNEFKYSHSNYLETTLQYCGELYLSNHSITELYDTIRLDEDVLNILRDMGGFAVEDWQEPSMSHSEVDDFANRALDILITISREDVYWFVALIKYLPEIKDEEEVSVMNSEFVDVMKEVLSDGE